MILLLLFPFSPGACLRHYDHHDHHHYYYYYYFYFYYSYHDQCRRPNLTSFCLSCETSLIGRLLFSRELQSYKLQWKWRRRQFEQQPLGVSLAVSEVSGFDGSEEGEEEEEEVAAASKLASKCNKQQTPAKWSLTVC